MKMLSSFVALMLGFTVIFIEHATACIAAPDHIFFSHDKAIDDADWIVRAKLKFELGKNFSKMDGQSQTQNGATLIVLEYIKGSGPDVLEIEEASSYYGDTEINHLNEANYYGHSISRFWTVGGNYGWNPFECRLHPSFFSGDREYLIFGPKDYAFGFEIISDKDDKWLEYVETRVKGRRANNPIDISARKFINNSEAIVRFEARWEAGETVWTETVLKGEKTSYANILFPFPAAFFDTAVNPNCREYGQARKLHLAQKGKFDWIYVIEKIPTEIVSHTQYFECSGADLSGSGTISARGIFSVNGFSEFQLSENGVLNVPSRKWYNDAPMNGITYESLLSYLK